MTVTVSIATLPERVEFLRQVVASLAPQVDHINLYLDGHDDVPSGLPVNNVMLRKDDTRWRGDAGKFYWADTVRGYHFTCDDDLIYPPNYVERMIETIESYGRKAAVGVLGTRFCGTWDQYYLIPVRDPSDGKHYKVGTAFGLARDWWVHCLGTGTLAYHTDTIDVTRDLFVRPNMADVWFALAARRQRVPCVCIARPVNWLEILYPEDTIWARWAATRDDHGQTDLIQGVGPWSEPLTVPPGIVEEPILTRPPARRRAAT
ncbi:MAG: hypothetical protein JSV86_17010 [Gemmatimonadota bacterium]|nr:MAG: hypothetical protein JSV86_17010 [Gemmatimonadota bacterium]